MNSSGTDAVVDVGGNSGIELVDEVLPSTDNTNADEFERRVGGAVERAQTFFEVALLKAEVAAQLVDGECELFCLLAENAPESLPGRWAVMHDLVRAQPRFWVYPNVTQAQLGEGVAEALVPYLKCDVLAAEWRALRAQASRVAAIEQLSLELGLLPSAMKDAGALDES
jgi:hypothetical protein